MDYRDERDALQGRVGNLEQALGEARRELDARSGDGTVERVADLERRLAEAQGLLQEIRRELSEVKGTLAAPPDARATAPSPSPDRTRAVAAALFLAAAAVVAIAAIEHKPHPMAVETPVTDPAPASPPPGLAAAGRGAGEAHGRLLRRRDLHPRDVRGEDRRPGARAAAGDLPRLRQRGDPGPEEPRERGPLPAPRRRRRGRRPYHARGA